MYYSNNVEIGTSQFGGKGLFATRDFQAAEDILRVPASYLIDYDVQILKHGFLGGIIDDKRLEFACCLLLEARDPQSKHKEYFDTLPIHYDNPITMPEELYALLQDQDLMQRLSRKRRKLVANFNKLCSVAGLEIPLAGILHFYALVESRTLYYPTTLDPKSEVGVLVPLYDMANHSEDANHCNIYDLFYYDKDNRQYVLKAYRDYAAGDQIHISYGSYNNSHFLQYYGFIPHNNQNIIQINLKWADLQLSTLVAEHALSIIDIEYPEQVVRGRTPKLKTHTKLHIVADGSVSESLLLKLICFKGTNARFKSIKQIYSNYRKAGEDFFDRERFNSLIEQLYQWTTSKYESLLDQDKQLLKGQQSAGQRICLMYRVAFKQQCLLILNHRL